MQATAALSHLNARRSLHSTEEQDTDPDLDELRAAGCDTVREEKHASDADRT